MLTGIITSNIIFSLVLIFGMYLLALEFFVPSFGVLGVAGVYLLIEAILAIGNVENPLLLFLISLVITAILVIITGKFILKNMEKNRLVLNKNLSNANSGKIQNVDNQLFGKTARVVKILRPSGIIEIEGILYNAISDGNYIEKDRQVIVEKIVNNQIYVKKINK